MLKNRLKLILFVVSCFVSFGITCGAQESELSKQDRPQDIVRQYQNWVKSVDALSFFVEETTSCKTVSGNEIKETSLTTKSKVQFNKTRKSFFCLTNDKDEQWESFSTMFENEPVITIYLNKGDENSDHNNSEEEKYRIASYRDTLKQPFDFNGTLAANVGKPMLLFGTYPLGTRYIMKDISETFGQLNLTVEQQKWKERKTLQLKGQDQSGTYELWIVPELGFMPVRLTFLCNKNVKRDDKNYFCFDLVVNDYIQMNDLFLPKSYDLTIKSNYLWNDHDKLKSVPSIQSITGSFTDFELNGTYNEDDFTIPYSIPDYTSVSMQDALQIEYIWLKGKIVPLTDELALERGKNAHFDVP